jgi:methylmalonyl-CoA mutase
MNNVVRTTVEALAAVFGGTQSLHTNGYDEALSLPCAEASRLARDTQLVLQHETGVCDVVDPWAGSYMMENLTADICHQALTLMAEIERRGGVVDVVESGWIQEQIHRSALNTQAEMESGKRTIVGVNNFVAGCDEDLGEPQTVDGRRVRALQTQRLAHIKARRDPARLRETLDALTRAARNRDGNLLELTVACMRARATVGECTQALEAVWPRYQIGLPLLRDHYGANLGSDNDWQDACRAVADAAKRLRRAPRVLIAKLGQDGHDRGARIVAAALSDAGFAVSTGSMFASPSDTARLAEGERVDVIGVSSLAAAQNDLVAELHEQLTERGLRIPIVVGGIIDQASQLVIQRSGVAACFPAGTPIKNIVPRLAEIAVAAAEERVEGGYPLRETA